MPNHRPTAIANEFLRRRQNSAWPQQMWIQKLVYIAHGWNLAINGKPLVNETPQAWDNGPVFRSIWDHIKENGYRSPYSTLVDAETGVEISDSLTDDEKEVIDHVWVKYGGFSAQRLSKMTHRPGTPWSNAYLQARNALLDENEIKNHYIKLGKAGRSEQ